MSQRLEVPAARQDDAPVPAGMVWTSLALALAGLAASAYLSYEHLTGSTSLACPETGRVNCAKVTSSSYSEVLGVPVAYLGLGFFVVVLLVCLPALWRSATPAVRLGRVALVGSGVAMVLYLVWAELYRVGAICLWCTGVHVLTLLLFGVVVFAEALRDPDADSDAHPDADPDRRPGARLGAP